MSAFVVSKTHLDAMVTAGLKLAHPGSPLSWFERDLSEDEERGGFAEGQPWGPESVQLAQSLRRELTRETAGRVGQMLWAENVRSVNHRYAEEDWEEVYEFSMLAGSPDPVVVLDAISCYEYQSCEHPGWRRSEAFRFCEALRAHCIDALPRSEKCWEINDPQVFVPKPAAAPALVEVDPLAEIAGDRNATIKAIRQALRRRSGKAWSVRGDRGTAWGWITISAPPARMVGYQMSEADQAELTHLLGLERPVHCQGVTIAASSDYRREYIDRAEGRQPSATGTPYWD